MRVLRNESARLLAKERTALIRAMSELSGWYPDTDEARTIRRMLSELEALGLYPFNGREVYDLEGCQKSCTYELFYLAGFNEYGDGIYLPVDNAIFRLTRYWGAPDSRNVEIMAYL